MSETDLQTQILGLCPRLQFIAQPVVKLPELFSRQEMLIASMVTQAGSSLEHSYPYSSGAFLDAKDILNTKIRNGQFLSGIIRLFSFRTLLIQPEDLQHAQLVTLSLFTNSIEVGPTIIFDYNNLD